MGVEKVNWGHGISFTKDETVFSVVSTSLSSYIESSGNGGYCFFPFVRSNVGFFRVLALGANGGHISLLLSLLGKKVVIF